MQWDLFIVSPPPFFTGGSIWVIIVATSGTTRADCIDRAPQSKDALKQAMLSS